MHSASGACNRRRMLARHTAAQPAPHHRARPQPGVDEATEQGRMNSARHGAPTKALLRGLARHDQAYADAGDVREVDVGVGSRVGTDRPRCKGADSDEPAGRETKGQWLQAAPYPSGLPAETALN